MKVQISQNASSPPPQGMSSLGMQSRVKYEQFYEFFPHKLPCSVAMWKVKKRRRLLACCRSQATAITGHSPASSCSWGKGCPPTPLGMRTPLPTIQPLFTVFEPSSLRVKTFSDQEFLVPKLCKGKREDEP